MFIFWRPSTPSCARAAAARNPPCRSVGHRMKPSCTSRRAQTERAFRATTIARARVERRSTAAAAPRKRRYACVVPLSGHDQRVERGAARPTPRARACANRWPLVLDSTRMPPGARTRSPVCGCTDRADTNGSPQPWQRRSAGRGRTWSTKVLRRRIQAPGRWSRFLTRDGRVQRSCTGSRGLDVRAMRQQARRSARRGAVPASTASQLKISGTTHSAPGAGCARTRRADLA